MLNELYESVKSDILKAAGPVVREADPSKHYLVRDKDGDTTWLGAEASPRDHKALDLQAVVEFAKRFNPDADVQHDRPVVWFSRNAVVCIVDDEKRRDRVTLPLGYSKQFQALQELERSKQAINQRDLIFMLRTTFKACLGPAGNLLDVLRQVKFNVNLAGESTVNRGKSSVGKSITSEISGTAEIPEYVVLSVPVFANAFPDLRADVELALEPDERTQTFQLFPLPNELENAVAEVERRVGSRLAEMLDGSDVPVYYGNP